MRGACYRREVTERASDDPEKLRARIEELERRLEAREGPADPMAVLEHAPMCVQLFDANGFSVYMNAAQQRFLGVADRESAYGKFNALTDPGFEALGVRKHFERAFAGEFVRPGRFSVDLGVFTEGWETRSNKAWVEVLIYPINGTDGSVNNVVALFWDVTAQREMERALVSAQRHESLALLSGGVAHDFNNLLVGILGNAALAADEGVEPEVARACVEDIKEAATQAAALTRQLLTYAGESHTERLETNLGTLVTRVAKVLKMSLPSGVTLALELDDADARVALDRVQFRQVALNLVMNAAEATSPPGSVTVRTRVVDASKWRSRPAHRGIAEDVAELVEFSVEDQGSGMDDATIERMFEPFFTTKHSGNGLGLAAVRGIVESHHGVLEVDSRLGHGTRITVALPRHFGAASEPSSTGG